MKHGVIAVVVALTAAAPAAAVQEGDEGPLAATRGWAIGTAAAEGLYPGGMIDAPEELWTLYIEGVTALESWDLTAAEASLTQGLKVATRDTERLALYHALAVVYLRRADMTQSRVYADRALKLAGEAKDAAALAYILKDASQVYRLGGDTVAGLALAQRGAEVAAQIDSPLLQAFYQLAAAEATFELGDVERGAALIDKIAPVFEKYESKEGQAQVEFYRGYMQYLRGDIAGASKSCREAVEGFKVLGDRHGEAQALVVIGGCLENQKDYDGALAAYNEALGTYRALGDRICEAKALLFCANVFQVWGQYDSAATALDEALAVGREYDVKPVIVEALKSRALCSGLLGDVDGCIRGLNEAKDVAAATGDDGAERQIDFALASLNLVKGHLDVDRAINELKDLEKRCDTAADVKVLAGVYDMLAKAYLIKKDVPNILTYRQRLVDLHSTTGDKKAAAAALSDLSLMLLGTYRYEESIDASRKAIALYGDLGDKDGAGYNYRGIGICFLKLNKYKDAGIALEKAAELHHGTGNADQLGRDYTYLCVLAHLTNREKQADEFRAAAKKLLGDDKTVDLLVKALLTGTTAPYKPAKGSGDKQAGAGVKPSQGAAK